MAMTDELMIRRSMMLKKGDEYALKKSKSPKFLALLYNAGLCASSDFMTIEEASLVTQAQFDALGKLDKKVLENDNLDGFKYFTGITTIGNSWFKEAEIKQITLPESLTTILYAGLMYTTIRKGTQEVLHIPASVATIGTYIVSGFGLYGTYSNNTKVVFHSTTPPNGFSDNTGNVGGFYVPDASLSAYQALAPNRTVKPISEL